METLKTFLIICLFCFIIFQENEKRLMTSEIKKLEEIILLQENVLKKEIEMLYSLNKKSLVILKSLENTRQSFDFFIGQK